MALSQEEKEKVIERLDVVDDVMRRIILSSIESFTKWMKNNLFEIFIKVAPLISKLWKWIVSLF